MKHLWDISIEPFMRYQLHYENYSKKIILSWYLINVKIRLLREVSNETFMRYHQWNIYEISSSKWFFVIIFIMKLISHKCFNLDIIKSTHLFKTTLVTCVGIFKLLPGAASQPPVNTLFLFLGLLLSLSLSSLTNWPSNW